MFKKVFRYHAGRRFLFQVCNSCFEIGVFFFTFRDFLAKCAESGLEEYKVFFENRRRAVLGDPALNFAKDGDAHDSASGAEVQGGAAP